MGIISHIILDVKRAGYRFELKRLRARDPRPYFKGKLSYKEGLLLLQLARGVPSGGIIIEIGCFGGLSTAYLLEGAGQNGAKVISIDPFDSELSCQQKDKTNIALLDEKPSKDAVNKKLKDFGFNNYELIQGFSYDIVKTWKMPIDLLWIDGNHDYEAVKQDYEQWASFIKIGGKIVFHDSNKKDNKPGWTKYGWEGPTRLTREVLAPPRWKNIKRKVSISYATKAF